MFRDALNRQPNTPLDPTRHNVADLQIRAKAAPRLWAAVWQQTPRVVGGNMINPEEWFGILHPNDMPDAKFVKWVRFYDLAFTEKELKGYNPSFTACVKLGLWQQPGLPARLIIAHIARWQAIWPTTKRRIIDLANVDGAAVKIGVEGGGPQKSAYDDLRADKALSGYTVKKLTPVKDKVARAQPWIDKAETGMIYFVDGPYKRDFFDECLAFPNASSKSDQIDAVSGAYLMLEPYLTRRSVNVLRHTGLYR